MQNVYLSKKLLYKTTKDLIRVGRNYDGGYLVSKKDIFNSEILISFGIYDDCTFELDFKKINPVKIFAYDASMGHQFF